MTFGSSAQFKTVQEKVTEIRPSTVRIPTYLITFENDEIELRKCNCCDIAASLTVRANCLYANSKLEYSSVAKKSYVVNVTATAVPNKIIVTSKRHVLTWIFSFCVRVRKS